MRIGIIGFGKMGMLHAGIVSAMADTEFIAVAEPNSFLTSFLKKLMPSLSIHTDYKRLLDAENLDAVFITTPVDLHVPIALECSDRKIPFFCEKPLTNTLELAQILSDEVEKSGVINMVGHMMRYLHTFQKSKKILDTGCLGNLITFNASIYVGQLFKEGKGWRYDKEIAGGGVLMNHGTHLVDLLYWYFGNVKRVSGQSIKWYSKNVEDFIHANLEFNNGLKGWLDASWSKMHHRLVDTKISIQGENGTLDVTDDDIKLYLVNGINSYRKGWNIFRKPDLFSGIEFDVGGPQYTLEDIDFFNAIKTGKSVESDVKSSLEVHRIIDGIYKSEHENGSSISLV